VTDTIDVTAEVMEQDIGPISRAERWLAEARGRASELAAQYPAPAEIADERAYRDARANRAAARKDAQELDSERKRMTRAMDDALKRFRADVRDVLAPLTDLDAGYKAAMADYEARWEAERRAELQEAYDEYAPGLVPLVPLERLVERYGCERGRGWLNRSTNPEAAKAGMRAAIDAVAEGEETLAGAVGKEGLEEAKADFFSTLDLGRAIAQAQARDAQRARVRELEEERALWAAQRPAEGTEAPEVGQVPTDAQTATQRGPQGVVDTGAVVSREEARALWEATTLGVPAPPSLAAQVALATTAPEPGRVPEFVFCGYGTRAQAEAFMEWCERAGVSRRVKVPTGGRPYKLSAR